MVSVVFIAISCVLMLRVGLDVDTRRSPVCSLFCETLFRIAYNDSHHAPTGYFFFQFRFYPERVIDLFLPFLPYSVNDLRLYFVLRQESSQ